MGRIEIEWDKLASSCKVKIKRSKGAELFARKGAI
jgi:hypothetical protein